MHLLARLPGHLHKHWTDPLYTDSLDTWGQQLASWGTFLKSHHCTSVQMALPHFIPDVIRSKFIPCLPEIKSYSNIIQKMPRNKSF